MNIEDTEQSNYEGAFKTKDVKRPSRFAKKNAPELPEVDTGGEDDENVEVH
jgi:hypothetical protein